MLINFQFWRKNGDGKYVQNYKLFTRKDRIHLNFKGVELLSKNFQNRLPPPMGNMIYLMIKTLSLHHHLTNGHQAPIPVNTNTPSNTSPGHQNVSSNGVYVPQDPDPVETVLDPFRINML